ncbi:MAG: hypothetical protein LBK61_11690 [Spirochaetaceae bacterium]|jgi:hypothetical protein|nr:hypothetical protein [Spirochaetaceae bacterium]
MKRIIVPCILFLLALSSLAAGDFIDGPIKLTLDDRTGRFSVFKRNDKGEYQNFLWDRNAKTSFLAVQIDGRLYKLGESNYFKTAVRGTATTPTLTFESPSLSVAMEFSFIKTPNANETNGIRIDIKLHNWGEKDIDAGIKLVLDTYFGEKKSPQFKTNLRYIDSETVINRVVNDEWWLAKDDKGSLMGSIYVEGTYYPDTLHFANWKRLSDAKWKATYVAGRNFNALPFSINDTAVAYYMEPIKLVRWDQRTMTVMLASEDKDGFAMPVMPITDTYGPAPGTAPADPLALLPTGGAGGVGTEQSQQQIIINTAPPPATPAPATTSATSQRQGVLLPIGSLRVDLLTLRELIYKIDEYIYFSSDLTEEELRAMEMLIARLRSRYGSVFSGYY